MYKYRNHYVEREKEIVIKILYTVVTCSAILFSTRPRGGGEGRDLLNLVVGLGGEN